MRNRNLLTHAKYQRKPVVRLRLEFDFADHQTGRYKDLHLAVVGTSTEEGRITLDLWPKDLPHLLLYD